MSALSSGHEARAAPGWQGEGTLHAAAKGHRCPSSRVHGWGRFRARGQEETVLPGRPQTPACASLTLRSSRSPEASAHAVPSPAPELCPQRLKPQVLRAWRVGPAPPRPSPPLARHWPMARPICPSPPRPSPPPPRPSSRAGQWSRPVRPAPPRPRHTAEGGLRVVPEGRQGWWGSQTLDVSSHHDEGARRRLEEAAQTLPGGFGVWAESGTLGWPGPLGFQQRPLSGRRNY